MSGHTPRQPDVGPDASSRARTAVNGIGWIRPQPVDPGPSAWEMPTSGPPDESDIVAMGADLAAPTLLAAYRVGLFPMPFDRRRIAWFSPDPRGILPLDGLRVSRSLRRSMRRYEVRVNTRFREVMTRCGDPRRSGAWINRPFLDAYERLHQMGWAHSVEVYEPGSDNLVGGLYGVWIDALFAGESMFHTATDASKVALVWLVDWLNVSGAELLDVQWTTPHLITLGAIDIPRAEYIERLDRAISQPTRETGSTKTDASDPGTPQGTR